MRFELTVSRPTGEITPLVVEFEKPVGASNHAMWQCRFSWRGAASGQMHAWGATSSQALTLAIDLFRSELEALFPDSTVMENGRPW